MQWRIMRHAFSTMELTSKISVCCCMLHNVSKSNTWYDISHRDEYVDNETATRCVERTVGRQDEGSSRRDELSTHLS